MDPVQQDLKGPYGATLTKDVTRGMQILAKGEGEVCNEAS